jgi:D-alanine-D-alanine ligase
MTIRVDDNWWRDIFDEVYLMTDARSVADDDLTRREVNFLEAVLAPRPDDPILDLCGGEGRHSLELARRGYRDTTILDYSDYLVTRGWAQARREGLPVRFVRGDARDTGLPAASYRFVLVMASSFGYFPDETENQRILREANRLLGNPGTLLLDLPDRDHVRGHFRPESCHEVNDDVSVVRRRELGRDILRCRETVISKRTGLIRENTYCTRLYNPARISRLLRKAGFPRVTCHQNFMGREGEGDFGCMTNRMVVLAEK